MSRAFRPLTTKRVKHKIQEILQPQEGERFFFNRNPRNLEKIRIAYKPSGYHLEKPGRSFWHKLDVNVTGRHINAEVKHFENGAIIAASTSEWAIKKQLYKTKDTAAFINLARVLAMRCLRSGITEISSNIEVVEGGKMDKFLKTLSENGISLKEPERIKAIRPWDVERPEKPWTVFEDEVQIENK